MPKKAKPKHGGRRIGAGRKPDGKAAKVRLSLRVDPVIKDYLIASGNASKKVEELVKKEVQK